MIPQSSASEPLVYRTFTRRALDDQYDTSKQLPDGNVQAYLDRFVAAGESAREACAFETVRYGTSEREVFDFFPSARPGAPLFVWIHGGYWRRLSKDAASFVAPPLVAAGVSVAILNYPLAPGPTLDDIVAAVRAGFAAAVAHSDAAGGSARAFVGGHSVGAQLAGMVAGAHEVGGVFTLSGLYDLEPLRHSHINEWIAMDAAIAERNSPLLHRPLGSQPLVVATGAKEQPEFHRQQQAYARAWSGWGGPVREIAAFEHDHFSIVLALADGGNPLTRALCEMVAAP
ncbi:MAG: alpha/beta hydrolase fold domain-containing protein [Candidatus Eremiobacteraeota bacterium]|nr:alpha/beta hydrolase fold domain-containing protein [Candidatus Eremiobacteraeota bacterium]